MAVRIRENGGIFCAALSQPEPGDTYLHDGISYKLSVELKALVTTPNDIHMNTGGEWWWRDSVPPDIEIDPYYL